MPRLHRMSMRPYQISKKNKTKQFRMDDVNNLFQVKHLDPSKKVSEKIIDSKITKGKFVVKMNLEKEYTIRLLVEKHGDNIRAMVNDKFNLMQYSYEQLERLYQKYILLNQEIQVDLREKYLKDVLLTQEDLMKDKLQRESETDVQQQMMNITYANRIANLQKDIRNDDKLHQYMQKELVKPEKQQSKKKTKAE